MSLTKNILVYDSTGNSEKTLLACHAAEDGTWRSIVPEWRQVWQRSFLLLLSVSAMRLKPSIKEE